MVGRGGAGTGRSDRLSQSHLRLSGSGIFLRLIVPNHAQTVGGASQRLRRREREPLRPAFKASVLDLYIGFSN